MRAWRSPSATPSRRVSCCRARADGAHASAAPEPRADGERADLEAVRERHASGWTRRARGRGAAARARAAHGRENLADLVDEGTFVEYGPLLFAAQERRRSREELIARTPADGLVAGVGEVDGSPCVAMSYDYTVLAGTQGMRNHLKKDRLFELAERRRLPVVLFAEGGGGRPGDVDWPIVAGLDCRAFHLFGRLSGLVPLVGIASGYCFAGNAALLGCCDVVIATEDSSIGMGGPAMIEGGGLGVLRARRGRPDRRAARKRRRRPARRRRARGGRGGQALPLLLPRSRSSSSRRPTSACCASSCPSSASAPTRCAGARRRCATRARCWSCAAASAPGMVTALAAGRGQAARA